VGVCLVGPVYNFCRRTALSGSAVRAAMDRTNSGPGCGIPRWVLVALRTAEFWCSSDSTRAARETTEMAVGGCSCCLIARQLSL
jgi:hypothetical protein